MIKVDEDEIELISCRFDVIERVTDHYLEIVAPQAEVTARDSTVSGSSSTATIGTEPKRRVSR